MEPKHCPPHHVGCPHDPLTWSADPECHSPGCPHDPLSHDPALHAKAWADLAPPGPDLAGRQAELAHVCVKLFREGRTADELLHLYMILQAYTVEDKWQRPGTLARNRQLAEDACKAVPQAKRVLRELIRICRDAADQNPRRLPDAKRQIGSSWTECRRQYEDALNAIDVDPALAFLRAIGSRSGVGGNPTKRRNGRLRRELAARGLTRESITTILQALHFIRASVD